MEPRFFGPTHSISEISLEYTYVMVKHLKMSYADAYNLPLWKRKWFVQKLTSDIKESEEKRQIAQRSASQNNANNSSRRLFGANN